MALMDTFFCVLYVLMDLEEAPGLLTVWEVQIENIVGVLTFRCSCRVHTHSDERCSTNSFLDDFVFKLCPLMQILEAMVLLYRRWCVGSESWRLHPLLNCRTSSALPTNVVTVQALGLLC
ncbi:PREDICTED: uncharacterized protein LOC104762070 [Camelina sativa]|uniref:Uncharacterized protein LOC104762070 n=1 Tax=Camelina sativa TaxID=90675 RepID=A0ABM0XBS1_CAMSA|nr:PREDICTED: uncharacterized protein LOC104762070 [Camelina sativa]